MVHTAIFEDALSLVADTKGKALLRQSLFLAQKPTKLVAYVTAVEEYEKFIINIAGYSTEIQRILVDAFLFALTRHGGQFYKWENDTVLPYTFHCAKTARYVQTFSEDPVAIITALWHDLLEDKRATKEEILSLLKQYKFLQTPEKLLLSLMLLDRNQYSGITKTRDYYSCLCSHPLALITKTADLLANLEACITRFNEMRHDESRFWIYAYFFEIEYCLLSQPIFLQSSYAASITKHLTFTSTTLRREFTESEQKECITYFIERRNRGEEK